ncbi:lipoprotein [Vibrio hyugaensis]|uniref:lipoprotein n=1 Tax=Vibrio hyugaensis TaxID=1534743 RepID=UPI000CE576FD|nr:lipoprotein [Vibrio hyugaensis]
MKRILTTFFIVTFLSACSSKPREVIAQQPLVSKSSFEMSGEVIPQKYWSQLESANQSHLPHPDYKILLSYPYMSALGTKCREVRIQSMKHTQDHVACLFSDEASKSHEWRLMPVLENGYENIAL